MNSKIIYDKLKQDFILDGITDDWKERVIPYTKHLTQEYIDTNIGLMFDFCDDIKSIYTAVFLSDDVVNTVCKNSNSLLVVHHPLMWTLNIKKDVFTPISAESISKLKTNNIAVYNMHTPLDNYSEYSTSKTLADALDLEIIKPFAPYFGTLAGVICKSKYNDIFDLERAFSDVVNHEVKLYNYGETTIDKIAVVAGGGNDFLVIDEMIKENVKTLVTGASLVNDHSKKLHAIEKEKGINVLGGTHYSTEKFAMTALDKYFKINFGIDTIFIPDKPNLLDL